MKNNIERLAKEADMRLQMQTIEGYCKAIIRATDGTQDMNESIVKAIHDISIKMLEAMGNYYKIENEINQMK